MSDPRRRIPGVDVLLESPPVLRLLERYPRKLTVRALREAQERVRSGAPGAPDPGALGDPETWARLAEEALLRAERPSLRRVINATGVVLHTNLGRAPLAPEAREAMARTARGYSNLEYDLEGGGRGSRYAHCVELLTDLTGAADALVVNNNAGALVLALNTLARGREVVVSRGELVEIGGGFRIPEVMERAGATLREVGTTNRTRPADYREAASGGRTGAILKVHRSNFRLEGFTQEASLPELADLGRELGLPLVHDLGSGLMVAPDLVGLPDEPRAAGSLVAGADVVVVSGDKLLGGPQAGIVVGGKDVVGAMRTNPLCRALRVDKVTLAGLEATLRLYRTPEEALVRIPALRMLALDPGELEARARAVAEELSGQGVPARTAPGRSVVGGGTCPGVELPTTVVRLEPGTVSAEERHRRLRGGEPPVVARVDGEGVLLDLRTVDPDEERDMVEAVAGAWRE